MSQARVDNIESIKAFKVAIVKFVESANAALGDADSGGARTLQWLEMEQSSYWNSQVRKRHEMVEKCKEAVRMKKLFKDSAGKPQSAVEEEKALRKAQAALAEAEQKVINVKRAIPKLQKEIQLYRGSVQRFASTVQQDLPAAASKLEDLLRHLDAYVGYRPSAAQSTATSPAEAGAATLDTSQSMARPEPAKPEEESADHPTAKPQKREEGAKE